MDHSQFKETAGSVYGNAVPARAPFCGLSALSELAEELIEINKLATKILVDEKGVLRRLLGLFRQSKLPKKLEQFAARTRKLAQRSQVENLFLDDDGMPLSMARVDITYETLLGPFTNLTYILADGALDPPSRVNKEMMTIVICQLVIVLHELGEGLRSELSHQPYQRTMHAVTRLLKAEEAWKLVAKA